MKKILFYILVILLTPIYLIIKILTKMIDLSIELVSPYSEATCDFVEDMAAFWKKIFRKEDKL